MFMVVEALVGSSTPVVVGHAGIARGTFGIGARDEDWDIEIAWPAIREVWDQIAARPNHYTRTLVTSGPVQIAEAAALALGIAQGGFVLLHLQPVA
jgi:hypothetical protein